MCFEVEYNLKRTMIDQNNAMIAFFVVACLLGFLSFLFFHFNRDTHLKRKMLPVTIIAYSVLFLTFVVIYLPRKRDFLFALPAVMVIGYLNWRNTYFCDACGQTFYNHQWFSSVTFCSKCGAKLP